MKKLLFPLLLLFIALQATQLHAQVTIGSGDAPTVGALLELKTQQAGTGLTDGADVKNVTSTKGGFLLPRVKIQTANSLSPLVTAAELSADPDLSFKLAGLMVYNITNNGTDLYPNVYTWDGTSWGTSGVNKSAQPMTVANEPHAFTFYETGLETPTALEFTVNAPKDTEGNPLTVSYQWYELTGNNLHVTVGTAISGATSKTYIPTKTIKGTTRNANNAGFYKFYCVATSNGSTLKSDIAEVAVGCGAKNNLGGWVSFMCFNLGADNNSTIKSQIDYSIAPTNASNGSHTYLPGEENLYGDLFQWGRIPDGHEKRQSPTVLFNSLISSDIGNGFKCNASDITRPESQIKKASVAYGKFIVGSSIWTPFNTNAEILWRAGRVLSNDPCAHYKIDGTYQEFWHEGTNGTTNSDACIDSKTSWRLPAQADWISIYKGINVAGSPMSANSNNWDVNNTNGRGFEIRPNGGLITTLFLPYGGHRNTNTTLYWVGSGGYYWSSTSLSSYSSALHIFGTEINPGRSMTTSTGMAVRCTKHE